jgi:hypothetical protein
MNLHGNDDDTLDLTLEEHMNFTKRDDKVSQEAEKVKSLRNITSLAEIPENIVVEKDGPLKAVEEKVQSEEAKGETQKRRSNPNLKLSLSKNLGMAISASALKVGKALLNAAFFYGQELEDEDNPKANVKIKPDMDYHKDELLVEGKF